jgi:quinoprotein glucose dehydrogenase
VAGLRALAELEAPALATVLEAVQNDPSEEVRQQALRIQSRLRPAGALAQIEKALQSGSVGEKQNALAAVGAMRDKAAADLLAQWLDLLARQQVQPELHLDVLEAAAKHDDNPHLKAKLDGIEKQLDQGSKLAPFRVSLAGGNAIEGRKIFFERAEAQCVRCHKIAGQASEGGGEVGPELTKVGAERPREHLLESIVFPNAQIAPGFDNLLVTTKDGTTHAGIVHSESETELVLNSPEDGLVTIQKDDIGSRQRGLSSMPEGMGALLTRRELRDLVEFLANRK